MTFFTKGKAEPAYPAITRKQDIWRRRMAAEMMAFTAIADEKDVVAMAAQALGRFIADHADTPHSVDDLTKAALQNLTLAAEARVRQLKRRFGSARDGGL